MLETNRITAVLTDAAEGYNPVHDVCRSMAETAVGLCGRSRPLLFEVDLVNHPDGAGTGIRVQLDEASYRRKIAAAHRYSELQSEVAAADGRYGLDAFRVEFLRAAAPVVLQPPEYKPYYEQVGEERVRQGRYQTALRYHEHVRPVLALLQMAVSSNGHHVALHSLH
jgi:hypothetical protein